MVKEEVVSREFESPLAEVALARLQREAQVAPPTTSPPSDSLEGIWNWLPVFRVVAETQHLPTAASAHGIGPSSLSRAIRRLETALGVELFHRRGRRIVLNRAGTQLLAETRDAMRLIERGVSELRPQTTPRVRVYAETPMRALIASALAECGIEPDVDERDDQLVPGSLTLKLQTNALQVAFCETPPREADLTTHYLGALPRGIYVAPGHALYESVVRSLVQLEHHAFSSCWRDGWPNRIPRLIASRRQGFSELLGDCLSGRYLAVLPDVVALQQPALRRFDISVAEPLPVHAIMPAVGAYAVARRLTQTVAAMLGAASSTPQATDPSWYPP